MIREILAEKLREFRKKKGMSTEEAAEKIGKSPKTINAWERGRGQPDADTLIKLCRIYDIGSISELFGEEKKNILQDEITLLKNQLNDEGWKKVIDYAEDLVQSGRYKKTPAAEEQVQEIG